MTSLHHANDADSSSEDSNAGGGVHVSSQDTDNEYIQESTSSPERDGVPISRDGQVGKGGCSATNQVISPELNLFLAQLVQSFKYEIDGVHRQMAEIRYKVELIESTSQQKRGEKRGPSAGGLAPLPTKAAKMEKVKKELFNYISFCRMFRRGRERLCYRNVYIGS